MIMKGSSFWRSLALTAIDLGRGTRISRFLPELEDSQWSSAEALAQTQIARLRELLAFASQQVPFYARLFAENNWDLEDFCTFSDLEKLPVVTKDVLKRAPLDFRPRAPGSQVAYKSRRTGGSTGEPFAYRVANDAFGMWWAATFRAWQGSGYSFGDRMVTLGGASLNGHQGNAIAQRIYNLLRNNHGISVGRLDAADLDAIVAQLNAVRPSLLYGYPSVLYLLARYIAQGSLGVQPLNWIVTTSEMLFPGQRKLIKEAFQAPVYDQYGCNEAALVAGECESHRGLHYAMEICLVEVLDNTGARVPTGHTGRLVATNLLNRAMCLIRYDTGDLGAVSAEPCECGRGLLRIQSLEGRSRDLIYTPGKKFIHGVAINHLIYDYPWVDRYQVVQETSQDLKMNLGVSSPVAPACVEQLRFQLAEYTGMTVAVVLNEPFVETSGKKNRLIISKIGIPDATE